MGGFRAQGMEEDAREVVWAGEVDCTLDIVPGGLGRGWILIYLVVVVTEE